MPDSITTPANPAALPSVIRTLLEANGIAFSLHPSSAVNAAQRLHAVLVQEHSKELLLSLIHI